MKIPTHTRRRSVISTTLRNSLATTLAVAALSAGAAFAADPVTIEFWGWSPHAQDLVDLFEASHPDIKVNFVNTGGGAAQYSKLQVAFAAGSGAPDVAMVEYPKIPEYALSKYIVPLNDLGGSQAIADFANSVVSQVTINGNIYGIPLDSAPLALGYRQDLYQQAGITELPGTWDDFAKMAVAFKAKFPDSYAVNSPISDGIVQQMFWQAGAKPIQIEGDAIKIDFVNDTTKQVLSYWVDLAKKGAVGTLASFTPDWNQGFASGKLAGWLMPAWGPVIVGPAAADTSGKWRVSNLPSKTGDMASAEWGGSSYTVTAQSKHPKEAAEFAIWVNHDDDAYRLLNKLTGSFPVLKKFADDKSFLATPFDFFGGQGINAVFAAEQAGVPDGWQWGPFQSVVKQAVNEQSLAAQSGKITVDQALDNIQSKLVSYAKDQGFTVK